MKRMSKGERRGAIAAVTLTLSACIFAGCAATANAPAAGQVLQMDGGNLTYGVATLPDGRHLACVTKQSGALSCDWGNAK